MRRRWKKTMGTSKIRLVAVDMDGTLLNRERKITQYTQNVIRRAVSQGVVFAPATGRAVNALPQELKDMEEIRGIFEKYQITIHHRANQGLKIILRFPITLSEILLYISVLRSHESKMAKN